MGKCQCYEPQERTNSIETSERKELSRAGGRGTLGFIDLRFGTGKVNQGQVAKPHQTLCIPLPQGSILCHALFQEQAMK